ncbi:hypothetical protein STAL104432_30540 [Streptomyces albus]
MDGVGVGRGRRDQGVSALVVRGDLLLLVAHDPGPLLRAGHDAVDRLVQELVVDQLLVTAGGEQGGLVEDVAQVGAGETGGTAGDRAQVHVGRHGLALLVDLEDLQPALHVGAVDGDLPVEAAGTQQGGVQDVGPVGGGDQDDAALDVEAVHLDQQLVERLLALVVTAAHAGAAVTADGVDLVDEDDGRRVGLGLLEQVADAGGAHTDEHLDEVGAGDRVERHPGLAGDRAGQQRLTGAGRAVEQHTLGDLGADGLELCGLLEELLDLLEFLDGLVGAGHVGERRLRGVLGDELGLRLAEVHHPGAATLHLIHQEQEDDDDQHERQQGDQHPDERVLLLRRDRVPLRDLLLVVLLLELLGDVDALVVDVARLDLVAVLDLGAVLELQLDDLLVAGGELGGFHLVLSDRLYDLAGVHRLEAAGRADDLHQHDHGKDGQHDPHDRPAEVSLHVHPYGARAPRPSCHSELKSLTFGRYPSIVTRRRRGRSTTPSSEAPTRGTVPVFPFRTQGTPEPRQPP